MASHVPRAIQLDSLELDRQFDELLTNKINNLNFDLSNRFSNELKTLLQLYLWYKKIYLPTTPNTIGLENFKLQYYENSQSSSPDLRLKLWQKYLLIFPTLFNYFKERILSPTSTHENLAFKRLLESFLTLLEFMQIFNCFLFIYNGRYRTICEWIVGIRVSRKNDSQNMNNLYLNPSVLNRQLLWNSMSELLTLVLPILSSHIPLYTVYDLVQETLGRHNSQSTKNVKNDSKFYCCQICRQSPVNVRKLGPNCRHHFCYYCISLQLLKHQTYCCKICKVSVQSLDQIQDQFS